MPRPAASSQQGKALPRHGPVAAAKVCPARSLSAAKGAVNAALRQPTPLPLRQLPHALPAVDCHVPLLTPAAFLAAAPPSAGRLRRHSTVAFCSIGQSQLTNTAPAGLMHRSAHCQPPRRGIAIESTPPQPAHVALLCCVRSGPGGVTFRLAYAWRALDCD